MTNVKEERKMMVEFLNSVGENASLKMSTERLTRKYNVAFKKWKNEQDKMPNPFAMSSTERNRRKRARRKSRGK